MDGVWDYFPGCCFVTIDMERAGRGRKCEGWFEKGRLSMKGIDYSFAYITNYLSVEGYMCEIATL